MIIASVSRRTTPRCSRLEKARVRVPLFTLLPRRWFLGNLASDIRASRKLRTYKESRRSNTPGSLVADRQAFLSQAALSMAVLCCWRYFSHSGSGAASWCRGEAVASHHFGERYGVGRAVSCGLDDGGHLAEVVRAEDARADDREHRRVDLMVVVEAVDGSARDAQPLAPAYIGLFPIDRPGPHALKPVDRLLVTVMAVSDGHSGCGWDVELEDCDGASRHRALEQESDRQLPDPDLFAWAGHHAYPYSSRCFG